MVMKIEFDKSMFSNQEGQYVRERTTFRDVIFLMLVGNAFQIMGALTFNCFRP